MFLTHHHYFQDRAMPYDDLLCHFSVSITAKYLWQCMMTSSQQTPALQQLWYPIINFQSNDSKAIMDIKIKKIERPLNISYSFYVKLDKIITINLPKTNITLITSSSILIMRMIHQWPKTFNFWSTLIYII